MNEENNRIIEHRAFILDIQKREKRLPNRNIKILPITFKLKNGIRLFSFIYRPKNLGDSPYPTVLHIRGTGFNSSATYFAYLTSSQLAARSLCQIIEIEHRLAPEYICPIGFQDTLEICQIVIKEHEKLDIDKNKIALCGYSSGGTFAALTAIQMKKEISLQILISPITDLSRSLIQFRAFENRDKFPAELAQWFIDLYLSNKHDPKNAKISPYWSEDLVNLPPTYILYAENDRFRGDSECYGGKLIEHGVWTQKICFRNDNHMMYWKNIRAIETIARQLKTTFFLTPIPRPLLTLFYKSKSSLTHNVIQKTGFIVYSIKDKEQPV